MCFYIVSVRGEKIVLKPKKEKQKTVVECLACKFNRTVLPVMMQSDLINNFTSTEDVIALIYKNVSQTTETPLEYHPCDERNVNFNCSAEEYLRFYRGPQTLPLTIVLPVSIFGLYNINVFF